MDTLIRSTPWRFYKNDEIVYWLKILKPLGYVRSLKLILNDDQYQALFTYKQEYEEIGLNKIYGGLLTDPLRGEGAGCSAFAMSFLRGLDLLSEDFDLWKRQLRIPLHLITTNKQSASTGFMSFIRGTDSSWAQENEPHFSLTFWDPELAYNWIQNVIDYKVQIKMPIQILSDEKFPSLVLDVREKQIKNQKLWSGKKEQIKRNFSEVIYSMNEYLDEISLKHAPSNSMVEST